MTRGGRTWWGQKWLDALHYIDTSNRLSQGLDDVQDGKIQCLSIDEGCITAQFNGSGQRIYHLQLCCIPLQIHEQEQILALIEQSPGILAYFEQGRVPEMLNDRLGKVGIHVLPRSWKDWQMHCNCQAPMPCRHVVAALCLLASRIDQDPMLLFILRGFDIIEALSAPKLDALACIEDLALEAHEPPKKALQNTVDFSLIPDLHMQIKQLLKAKLPFVDEDFKKTLLDAYRHWQRMIRMDHSEAIPSMVAPDQSLYLQIDNCLNATWFNAQGPIQNITEVLRQLPRYDTNRGSSAFGFFQDLNDFVQQLIYKSAFIPQVVANKDGDCMVMWQPALLDPLVRELFYALSNQCPEHIIAFLDDTTHWLCGAMACRMACAAMLSEHLRSLYKEDTRAPLHAMFFAGKPQRFDTFETQHIPDQIHRWLRPLDMHERSYRIHLLIKEYQNRFSFGVRLSLVQKEDTLERVQPFLAKHPMLSQDVLLDLSLLYQHLPSLKGLVSGERGFLHMELKDFAPILTKVLPIFRMLGVVIMLPKAIENLATPKLLLDIKAKNDLLDDDTPFLNLDQLLTFDWKIAIGKKTIDIETFQKMVKQTSGLVRMLDQYVLLDHKALERLLKKIPRLPTRLTNAALLQATLAENYNDAKVSIPQDLEKRVARLQKRPPTPVPNNLQACLRPYQKIGYQWLVTNTQWGFGSLLADDMGLGKTLQVIALLLHLKNKGQLKQDKALIIVPTTLLGNWRSELKRFAPSLKLEIYHGQDRSCDPKGFDVLITNYGLARRDVNKLGKQRWHILIIDEAQWIKNPTSEQSKCIKRLKATQRIAMTGTPVENRLMDYWSLFDFINKGYLGAAKTFQQRFATPIEKERNQTQLNTFNAITRPFILRRLKSDPRIMQDLPDKIQSDQMCPLTLEQAALYQQVVDLTLKQIESSEGIARKGLIFSLIHKLKQICNHPAHYLKANQGNVQQSGKMERLLEILADIAIHHEKVLIFTQYVEMGHLIASMISQHTGQSPSFLHGGLTLQKRDAIIDAFQNDPTCRILIVSLKAGGTGLNLTAANHVIHFDLWWNPAVEAQATDRVYRIGQTKNVIVHRMITEHTFEERINDMLMQKKALANLTVSSGESWLTELSNKQLKALITMQS